MRISDIFNLGRGDNPPPTDAECAAMAIGASARAACAQLQDPAVWYSGATGPDDYYPVPQILR
jgi:hypothetical protein